MAKPLATALKSLLQAVRFSKSFAHGSCLPLVGRKVRACGLSRLQHPWPSHNFRNTSPCLVGWMPSPKGPLPPGHQSFTRLHSFASLSHPRVHSFVVGLRSVVRSHGSFALGKRFASFVGLNKKGSLAGVAPARPQLRPPAHGISFVTHLSPPRPTHQHRRDIGYHAHSCEIVQ